MQTQRKKESAEEETNLLRDSGIVLNSLDLKKDPKKRPIPPKHRHRKRSKLRTSFKFPRIKH
jgi:hypothetical protein